MESLFAVAYKNGIDVEYHHLPISESISCEYEGSYYIGIDYSLLFRTKKERVHLAHELGHCMTGSVYKLYSDLDIRERHEYRANKWAAKQLIPPKKLKAALEQGYVDPWDLAERFDVTEDFVRMVFQVYKSQQII